MHRTVIDQARFVSHRGLNRIQSTLLLGLMSLYVAFLGWLLWGLDGLWFVLLMAVMLVVLSPASSSHLVLRMYQARPLPPAQAPQYHRIMAFLAERAGLPSQPSLWWVPSSMVNAFAVGRRSDSAVAVTAGLLRTLTPRELVAVMAHETAHIAHGDLFIMGLADSISRITSAMGLLGSILLILAVPQALLGWEVSWWPLLLLAAAPQVSLLAQLGLSRTREFDADLTAAQMTDDPEGLAAALIKLERIQKGVLHRLFFPGRGVPEPSWLRTHPTTRERVRRLLDLKRPDRDPWSRFHDLQPPEFPGVRPLRRPSGGWWGYWY
jgi:heat shock protein HtpX